MKIFMKRYFLLSALLAGVFACSREEAFVVKELGVESHEYILEQTAGHLSIPVYSNQICNVEIPSADREWLRIDLARFQGDNSLTVDYKDNDGFPRMSRIIITGEKFGQRDTIAIKQQGAVTPTFRFTEGGLILPGSKSGIEAASFELNVDYEDIGAEVRYVGAEKDWITNADYSSGKFLVSYKANPSGTSLRLAQIVLSYTDGWGEKKESVLNVTQQTKDDRLGEEKSFAEVRSMGRNDATVKISDNVILNGIVVSEKTSRNCGENPQLTFTSIDYTVCDRTVYLESEDGAYGFALLLDSADDNVFERYDHVKLNLAGTSLYKATSPERYTISGVTQLSILTRKAGTAADVPVKQMYFSSLEDRDIYTYVTLQECEFAVRKGSLTPIHEGYTLGDGISMMAKYPRLILDSQGSAFYLYTNTTCPYRRTGRMLPYGSGSLSGVVVFEYFPSYVYGDGQDEESHGRIGSYQIRHQAYEDIAFADESTFSNILAEYRYVKGMAKDEDGYTYWYPTLGTNGRFTNTALGRTVEGCTGATTWNYLGPVGTTRGVEPFKNHVGCGPDTGIGVILEDNSDYLAGDSSLNADGKGQDGKTNGWLNYYWWDNKTDTPYYWKVEFSTAGINGEYLSCQFTAQSGRALLNCSPIYWQAEYSIDDEDWTKVASYQVPDFPVYATYREWQLPAYKQININLPSSLFGQEKVYLRLGPESSAANTLDFAGGKVNGGGSNSGNAMDYFAIRYH